MGTLTQPLVHLLVGGPFDGKQVHLGARHMAYLRLPVNTAQSTWVTSLADLNDGSDLGPVALYRHKHVNWDGVETRVVVLIFDCMEPT